MSTTAGSTPSHAVTRGLYARTLRGLLAPRRAIPVGVVCVALVFAQGRLASQPMAVPLGGLMCLTFLLSGPYLWRRLDAADRRLPSRALHLLAYAVAGAALTRVVSITLPRALGLGSTLLTSGTTAYISLALFWVGGWGLGRDLDYEERVHRERARAEAMEREAQRAQLLAVRSHLDPHFLFNTLNAIAEWCRQDGEVAERAILKLSSMLRTVLSSIQLPYWSLRKELELVDALLELHLVRDAEMFRVERDVEVEPSAHQVPPLILLPLIENAVKHGPAAGKRGTLRIHVSEHGGMLTVQLSNPGRFEGPREGGHGLATTVQRLALAYDGAASFAIDNEGATTRVTVQLPSDKPPAHRA
jgi:two-component system, LytTR family, sensor histidine kinase AlgZ